MSERRAMQELEGTLQALKAVYGRRIGIVKANKSEPGAPFPLLLTLALGLPESASHFDVSSVSVHISITRKALAPPCIPTPSFLRQQSGIPVQQWDTARPACAKSSETSNHVAQATFPSDSAVYVLPGIRIAVAAAELPNSLIRAMANELAQYWRQHITSISSPTSFASGVDVVCKSIPGWLPGLLSLLPTLLEHYESVDEGGGTVRRITFLPEPSQPNPCPNCTMDCMPHSPQASCPHQFLVPPTPRPTQAPSPLPQQTADKDLELPRPIAREFLMLRARLGPSFTTPAVGTSESTLDLPSATPTYTFSALLQPSDPKWQRGPLSIMGYVAEPPPGVSSIARAPVKSSNFSRRQSGPAPGGLIVGLEVLKDGEVDGAACVMVNKMLQREAELVQGCLGAPRALIRFLETHAATMIHTAWDVLLDTAPGGGGAHNAGAVTRSAPAGMAPSGALAASALETGYVSEVSEGFDESGSSTAFFESGTGSSGADSGPATVEHSSSQHAVELSLAGLRLDNVDCMQLLKLKLQVQCCRCKSLAAFDLDTSIDAAPGAKNTAWLQRCITCAKCCAELRVQLLPHMIHAHCNKLAYIKPAGCVPVDLLPAWYTCQCAGCGKVCGLRDVQVGQHASRECRKCFKTLQVVYTAAELATAPGHAGLLRSAQRSSSSSLVGKVAAQRTARCRQLQAVVEALEIGRPLPRTGACHHYSHSHRWLRFPCCGMRFPCDLCHEELTDGHEMRWARRMICGYCSFEQPCADRCSHCGKRLAASASHPEGRQTRHWEGGKGCRDRNMLDPKDKQKYRNSKNKTVSRRAARKQAQP